MRDRIRWATGHAARRSQAIYLDRVLSPMCGRWHRHYDPADTVSLLGTRRGGTTWVQELLAAGPGVCPLFEPLYGSWFRRRHGVAEVPVLAPDQPDPALARYLTEVMCGRQITPRLRRLAGLREVVRADRFVVKHVRMNLAAGWLVHQFPSSPVVVLVRHPCAVVESLSRMAWGPDTAEGVLGLLAPGQRRVVAPLVEGRRSAAAAQAAVWAVEVRTLLDQTDPQTAALVTYEELWGDAVGVLGPVMESLGLSRPDDLATRSARPSRTSHPAFARRPGDPVGAWSERLDRATRDEILAVVAVAGVEGYGPDPWPDVAALADRHARRGGVEPVA